MICKFFYAFQCSENVKDFLDTLILTQKEAIAAGEEEAKLMTDTHLVQTVMDLFAGKKKQNNNNNIIKNSYIAHFTINRINVLYISPLVIGRINIPLIFLSSH